MADVLGHPQESEAYTTSGVNVAVTTQVKELIRSLSNSTLGPQVIHGPGLFGGAYSLGKFDNPVLVSSADNVGTKLKVAALAGRYDTVGQDVVNQNINDILTMGARPIFFLDYIAMESAIPSQIEAIMQGIVSACNVAGCALIGGETAELPGVYQSGAFDLVGFVIGTVEKHALLNGSRIKEGDVLLGLPSSGLHTNGYSLVRKVFHIDEAPTILGQTFSELGTTLGDTLLEPHRCYYRDIEPALPLIIGMAHITGGGIEGNVPRILPDGLAAEVQMASWEIPPIFKLIQTEGRIPEEEMYQVFNMGIGMVVVSSPDNVSELLRILPDARPIGRMVAQSGINRLKFV
jgi:phosphoribosylformylglycinamidine cyclo-ligase